MALQRTTWKVERVAWVVLTVILVLALLGLFSNGPISSDTAVDGTGRLQVAYGRFVKNGAGTDMQLRVETAAREEVAIRLGSDFVESFRIDAMSPEPVETHSGAEGVRMVFRPAGEGPLEVYFFLTPQGPGLVRNEIGITGETPARFTQVVYP